MSYYRTSKFRKKELLLLMLVGVATASNVTPVFVRSLKDTYPIPVSGFVARLVFTGFDSRTPHEPVVSKSSEANIWLSSYYHLTDVGGQSGERVHAFYSTRKKLDMD